MSTHTTFGEALEDRNIYLLAGGKLFKMSELTFRLSEPLRDMINSAHVGSESEGTRENPIILDSLTEFELGSFLKVLTTPIWIGLPRLNNEEWAAALHVATMYGFRDLRTFIIKQVDEGNLVTDPPTRIELAIKYRIGRWIHPAYVSLCSRAEPLTADEGRKLGFDVFAALCAVRENTFTRVLEDSECDHGNPFTTISKYTDCVWNCSEYLLGPDESEDVEDLINESEQLKVPPEFFEEIDD